ncbi:MAG: hypothetical protein ACFFAS_05240 [Promethearchaeota archaeon]
MSDRIIELRLENRRLKEQVQSLEDKVLSLVGAINIQSSGVFANTKHALNDLILELLRETENRLNIVSPKIGKFYATEIKNLAAKGIEIFIITNDRGGMPGEHRLIYDEIKSIDGVKVVNNPNVRYLLVFNSKNAIYSGGSLDKDELEKSILIATTVESKSKLKKISEIFNMMLPSFMR